METKLMKIADLQHPEKNTRIHPKKQLEELNRSVNMFGQIRPIVVDENGTILTGNGLVMAYREAGREEINVLVKEGLSDTDKKKLMIADNRTYSLGMDDNDDTMALLHELDDFDVPGYEEEMLEKLLSTNFDEVINDGAVKDYGVIPEEEREKFDEAEERKERHIERGIERRQEEARREIEDEEQGIFKIQCPHCGGHIRMKE